MKRVGGFCGPVTGGQRRIDTTPASPQALLNAVHACIGHSGCHTAYTELQLQDCNSTADLVEMFFDAQAHASPDCAGQYSLLVFLGKLPPQTRPAFAPLLLAALPASCRNDTLADHLHLLLEHLPTRADCPAEVRPHLDRCVKRFLDRFDRCFDAYERRPGAREALSAIKRHVEQHLAPANPARTGHVDATPPARPDPQHVVGAARHIMSCKPIPLSARLWTALSHLSRGSQGIAPLRRWLATFSTTQDTDALLSWLWGIHPGAALGLRRLLVQACGPLAPSVPATAPDVMSAPLMHATGAARYLLALAGAHPSALSCADPRLDPPTVSRALSAFATCGSEREVVAFLRSSTPRQLLGVLACLGQLYPPAAKAFAFVAAKAILGARTRAVAPGLKAIVVAHWPAAARWNWGAPSDTPENAPYTERDLADLARDLQAMALPEPVFHALKRLAGCSLGAHETASLTAIHDMPDPILGGVLDALSLSGDGEAVRRLAALARLARNRPPEVMDWLRGLAGDGTG